MNHIESAFTGKNSFWRYLVMIVAVLLASNTIGSIPLLVGYYIKSASNPDIAAKLAANPSDFSVMGFDPNVGLALMVIPFVAALIAFILLVKPLHKRTFKQTINGTSTIRWKKFFISGLVWAVLQAFT